MKLKQKILYMQDGKACTKDVLKPVCVSTGELCPEIPSIKVVPENFTMEKARRFWGRWQKMAVAARVVLKIPIRRQDSV